MKNGSFKKNLAVLITGTGAAQALTIASAPILSRIYSPEAFGIFALYTALISIFTIISTFKYEVAIVLPKKEKEAINLIGLSFILVFTMSVLLALFLTLFSSNMIKLMDLTNSSMLWWLPISVFFAGIYQILNYWSTRTKQINRLSWSKVSKTGSSTVAQVFFGLVNSKYYGLIAGQLIGQIISIMVLLKNINLRQVFLGVKFKRVKHVAYKHLQFPLYGAPQGLFSTFSQHIPIFLLAFYFGPAITGLYSISMRMLRLPVSLISDSVKQIFYQKASEVHNNNGNCSILNLKVTVGLALLGVLPTIILIFFAPEIFKFVLGESWYDSGVYAQWLIILIFFKFIQTPTIALTRVYSIQKYMLYYEVVFLLLTSGSLVFVLEFYNDPVLALALYSIFGAVLTLLMLFAVSIYVFNKDKNRIVQ